MPFLAETAHDSIEISKASRNFALGSLGGLVLVNWRHEVMSEDVDAVIHLRDDMLAQERFRGSIHIGEPGLAVPHEALRETARRALENRQSNRGAIALVILGEGFGASAIRSVGTAVFALRGAPTRLFAKVHEAAAWMVESMHAYDDVVGLAKACEALRGAGL